MTREEMLRRLEEGVDALAIAIIKWEDIWLGISVNFEGSACALCYLFQNQRCKYCPIYRYTGKALCNGTPYSRFVEHYQLCAVCGPLHVCEKGRRLARKEVNFLKKLDKW